MKITFVDKHNKKTVVANNIYTSKGIHDTITNFLASKHYKLSYFRIVGISKRKTMIDFGSWTEFFFVNTSFTTFIKIYRNHEI